MPRKVRELMSDLERAGFVVLDVPLRTTLAVAGSVQRDGGVTSLSALGARY